jgi:hypothetical protein
LIACAHLAMYNAPLSGPRVVPVVRVTSTTWSSSFAATATSASCSGFFTGIVRPASSERSIAQNAHWSSLPQYTQVWITVLARESRCRSAICQ